MGITIAEKQHWKERLASRIDRAIKDLYQAKAPDLRKQVKAEAADMVKEKFGIKELCDRADELDSKKRSIKKQYSYSTAMCSFRARSAPQAQRDA
jgi:hypothetical protein